MTDRVLAWHFLRQDRRLRFEPHTLVEPGHELTVDPPLNMCSRGLHASLRPIDALQYAPGAVVCRVELSGDMLRAVDKVCAQRRKTVWMADATNTLHEFACWCAERALDLMASKGVAIDPRSRGAIIAKRRWLDGEISDEDLAAARAAAYDAACAAACDAAWAVAWDVACAAACAAARAAACDAACAAACAAAWAVARAEGRDPSWDARNTRLEEMLMQLKPGGVGQ